MNNHQVRCAGCVRAIRAGIFLLLLFAAVAIARAAEVANPALPPSASPQLKAAQPDTAPVPVPEPSPKALSRYRSSLWLSGTFYAWNLFFPTVLLFTGFSTRLRSWAQRLGRRWYLTFTLYVLAFGVAYYLVSLPMYYWIGYVQSHRYGLSTQTQAGWLRHYFKSAGVTLATGLVVGWVPFLLVRRSPRRWWLYLGLLQVPLLCVSLLIQPIWIAPLFNKFRPLQNKRLEARILAQAARGGIDASRVFEVNRSKTTRTMNAYVTGFLGTKRIVLWDTLLKALDEDELLFILGHEMGHYVLGHILKQILLGSALGLLGFYAAYLVAGRIVDRFKAWFGFDTLSDFAALPLGMVLFLVLSLVGVPIALAISRHYEHEADRFGLELTRKNQAAARSFVKLQAANLSIPRPGLIYTLWRGSHPALADRIEFCNHYRPWETGQALYYERYVKP
jgi:STE24 endopeptidase